MTTCLDTSTTTTADTATACGADTSPHSAFSIPHSPLGAAAPAPLALSTHFSLTVNGRRIAVHQARVSAIPFNRVWPGHQRPLDQTELASFATFDADFLTPAVLIITLLDDHPRASTFATDAIALRPVAWNLSPAVDRTRRTLTLRLDRPRHFTVEIGGQHHALHLFANPPADYELPAPDSPDLLHFGPGIHHAGLILPRSGQTIHIAEGAIVYGAILVRHADNVRIVGRGILDTSPFLRGQEADETKPGGELFARGLALGIPRENLNYTGNITAIASANLTIDGIILRDSPLWSTNIRNGCRHVTINNLKIIGQWRYNADGINICSSSHIRVSRCFIRSFDDGIIARGTHMLGENTPLHDMRVTDCVIWCDWGRALEVWTGHKSASISRVVYENIQIIRTTHIALGLQVWWGSPDTTVSNIRFEDISIEAHPDALPPHIQEDDNHPYPFPPDTSRAFHIPDLFCANLCNPGEEWQKYFASTPGTTAKRSVYYGCITLKNIRYTGPDTPSPRIIVGSGDDILQIHNIHLENIRINDQASTPPIPLNLTTHSNVQHLTFRS
ncbi:glycosyl hydrolase family 28 protein [Geminisphaera colitermitum]|uniref:glycosyl hydrolase family 28 protein n=1 Tax=Geminisphaera colitermitum TaxID=1148786 RepID=UPI000158CAEC|nr:glycosyl hydrolase family 28 protein [Geminisphaera colitermitum]